ncbi:pyridoxal-phosphate dependent enzyme [Methyloprofundus sp.]|uniref:pyridoxal-phosphate dependent enzyme n=1 Tax=Methyloprofundus sp. TaxID=2020875 RepID=UPI003D10BAC1
MSNRYASILETIGNTPVVRINKLGPKDVNIFVKVESFNPMGSVKDRLALGVIEDAERRGELQPGQTIVEATSGNTGIGLAMVCAQKGYPLVICMAENFSVERRKMIRFLGAQVILTPASDKGSGMVAKAAELAEANGWWQPKQFENPANADTHAKTTAVEILRDFADISLDYWVSGFGTGGTLNGVSRVLKAESPFTKIMVCEPDNSQILASGIAQLRNADGSHSASHPNFRPHLMQGWSPDFIPQLAEQALNCAHIDGYIPIDGNFSLQCAKDLAQKEGIFVGISAGATLAGALTLAESVPEGSNILCMLPDTGERYLSTPLFDDVASEMTTEEQAISRSTPGFRFDLSAPPCPIDDTDELDEHAVKYVEALVNDLDKPIIMFALEWCEFCWSVRKVLDKYEIPYHSVDLDSVAFQEDNRGTKMRTALRNKTAWNTFPQIFIQGKFLGGCTDLFDGCKDGSLLSRLDDLQIPRNDSIDSDPYSFLPGWLHPR